MEAEGSSGCDLNADRQWARATKGKAEIEVETRDAAGRCLSVQNDQVAAPGREKKTELVPEGETGECWGKGPSALAPVLACETEGRSDGSDVATPEAGVEKEVLVVG